MVQVILCKTNAETNTQQFWLADCQSDSGKHEWVDDMFNATAFSEELLYSNISELPIEENMKIIFVSDPVKTLCHISIESGIHIKVL